VTDRADLAALGDGPFDTGLLTERLGPFIDELTFGPERKRFMRHATSALVAILDTSPGVTLQDRWERVEAVRWSRWDAGLDRPWPAKNWTWGPAALVLSRAIRPGWLLLSRARLSQWLGWLPAGHPLPAVLEDLKRRVATVEWSVGFEPQRRAALLGLRLVLAGGYQSIGEITDEDLKAVPVDVARGLDLLDAVLCETGGLGRTPQRGAARRLRGTRHTPAELVAASRIPEQFRAAHQLYLETYQQRISDVYPTTRHKHNALEHLWLFLDETFPDVGGTAEVRREHLLAFIPRARERARAAQRGHPGVGEEERSTAHSRLVEVRCFFADVCIWATEEGSPFQAFAPPAVPLERHDLRNLGFEQARRRQAKRALATILDLEREVPGIRALATQRWQQASTTAAATPGDRRAQAGEVDAFWDWALIELLCQSGLRIEEACELTTLDVLRRTQPDGRVYYLLHVKPSKFDRARVIPIGDGLGRVLAQIIAHVKRFYRADHVPACDHWDAHEKVPRPTAPYLLQGVGHPSPIAYSAVRQRLARVSRLAGARRADGSPLLLRPHDCRRLFASELLNNNVPVHVIGALLGHASVDTVMVLRQALPGDTDRGVPQGRARDLQRLPRPRQPARPHHG
jgi:integrase